jgi:hypothetical protein
MSSLKKATIIVGIVLMCNIFLFIAIGCGLEQGTYTYEDGSEYVGELKDGLPVFGNLKLDHFQARR